MSDTTEGRCGERTTNRRNVLRSIGTAGIGGASMALFDGEIVQGVNPRSLERSEVDWSSEGNSEGTFPLSVMSGGPTDSGAILWTKLAADAVASGEPVYVQVAKREDFADPIYEGKVSAETITAEHDYVVKADLDGELPADAHLYYRFHHAGTTSRTGRCRTLPKPEASPESVSLAIANCQLFQHGYYPAYSYIAEEDIDYIVHLGDQIYEYAGEDGYGNPVDLDGRSISLPSGKDIAWTLEDFRHLWSTYRGDEFFQQALERHTFVPTWDDHEIVNNRYWDYENEVPFTKDHPKHEDEEFMKQLFMEGIKAWWEYNPARVEYDPEADSILDSFHMWRSLRFGDLLELPVTDERLFSSLPPGGDAAGQRQWGVPPNAPEADDADRTRLGFEQREWFLDTLKETDATWKVWANEVAVAPLWLAFADDAQFARNYDAWDGYQHERNEIMGQLTHFDIDNFVTLTGDMHTYLVSYLLNGWEAVENRTPTVPEEEWVGVEFMAPAISSNSGISDFWGIEDRTDVESESDSLTNEEMVESVLEESPHVEFFNATYNGYAVAEFTPEECIWTAYAVDDTVDEPDAPRVILTKYRVPEGKVALEELESNDGLPNDSLSDGGS